MDKVVSITARRVAYFMWNKAGLDPEETIDSIDQAECAETMQDIIDGKGPKWVLKAVKE